METMILEKENEIGTLPKNQEEDSWIKNDVLVIILLNKNFDFVATRTPYDIDICGKKMWEWVALSCLDCEIKTTVCTEESDILTLIKPYLNNKKWTFVLYSDTPLFSTSTFISALEYVRAKQVNVLKLQRGYVFNTEYIKNAESLIGMPSTEFGTKQDFFVVDNSTSLYEVNNIIKNRIIDFHIKNGIIIDDKNSVHIDANVVIESGTVIKQNNALYGLTYIGKNCVLEPNNVIKDSIISNNCVVKYSYIEESRISENIVVGPFESVINKSN